MSELRWKAIDVAQNRVIPVIQIPEGKVTDFYGIHTFTDEAMKTLLSPDAYKKVSNAIKTGDNIEGNVADEVASAMKSWAISKGATHYTHWFQPLTGGTAEKHDAFFDISFDGHAIEKFKGSALVQQESDASSLPNGGIRETFEARGYTVWDPNSPAFISYNSSGTGTLCIPSIYFSYTGELLDAKTPLLNSSIVLDKAATSVANIFDRNVEKVTATCGIEQEYFLVDKALYHSRPDLIMCGRSVFGHSPAKGQQLEDHYFGSIPPRINAFMVDFEIEALKIGIPVRTRHNEVAPGQFEVAPTFEEINLACDHNILLMDVMKKTAQKHNFEVMFHEKPFAGINGSGKHNNWSIKTDTGVNLLGPSTKPKESLRFVTFLVNIVKAVHDHADMLRATVATAGNEHRLGANEAPPAIISVFLGTAMTKVLEDIENKEIIEIEKGENAYIKLGLNRIPSVLLDNTDRNRTSPFAFTGNKFEFRAVGSSANSATPMMVLNTIVAKQLESFRKEYDLEREKDPSKKEGIILKILKRYIKESKNILFEGNGYSKEWEDEAAKRGLSNIKDVPKALEAYISDQTVELFENMKVLNKRELHARYEIRLENYIKKIQIESRVIGDLAQNHVVSTAIKYQTRLVQTAKSLIDMEMKEEAEPILNIIREISKHVNVISKNVKDMTEARKKANNEEEIKEKANIYSNEVRSFFDVIRKSVDKLELIIDDEDWPLTKYRELFIHKIMNDGYKEEEIEQLKAECEEEEQIFVLVEDEEDMSDENEFAHFQFVGKHEGKEVIYDALLSTLSLHHSSLLYEEAETKVAKLYKDYVPFEERVEGSKVNEEAEQMIEELIEEMEDEETVKVAEFCEIDMDFEYGIGLDVALNVEEITVEVIEKFINDFNNGTLKLDKTAYSFKHGFDED